MEAGLPQSTDSISNNFEEKTKSNVIMSSVTDIDKLKPEEVVALAAVFKDALTPPGHMSKDKAKAYMTKINALFDGEKEINVKFALAGWSAIHDVGAVQDFSGKPPVVCGARVVPATEIYGGVIPVTAEGLPRQFCATMFEEHIDTILQVFPQLHSILAARCASAGLPTSDPKAVISFVKGVTPATMGGNIKRMSAKTRLLSGNATSPKLDGATQVAELAARQTIVDASQTSGHGLY